MFTNGLELEVRKDHYTGLWNIWYKEGHSPKWAGPFKTKREAAVYLKERTDD